MVVKMDLVYKIMRYLSTNESSYITSISLSTIIVSRTQHGWKNRYMFQFPLWILGFFYTFYIPHHWNLNLLQKIWTASIPILFCVPPTNHSSVSFVEGLICKWWEFARCKICFSDLIKMLLRSSLINKNDYTSHITNSW